MKIFKFLLVSLLVMLGTTAFAQDVVIHMKDGTEEVIANVDSVVYETHDIGYYSFNATSKAEIKNLTEDDFTKLTEATSRVDCGVACMPVVLTEGTTAPKLTIYSNRKGDWLTEGDMSVGTTTTGATKVINGKTYNLWYVGATTSATDNSMVNIKIQ